MHVTFVNNLADLDADLWNRLAGNDCPFLSHEFLSALEACGSVSEANGWLPRHLLVYNGNDPIAALPFYLKYHSYGEYVFDQSWAQAYHRHGQHYYPKGLTAIPFTPCSGARLLIDDPANLEPCAKLLIEHIRKWADETNFSSWHCLFPDAGQTLLFKNAGLAIRDSVQFQWFNRNYRDFADFLDSLTADKRKMIKRERRKIREAGIEIFRVSGPNINDLQWQRFYQCYQSTYRKHGMAPYLNFEFFLRCAASMPERMLLTLASKDKDIIGAALNFIGSDTLYGRHWGCLEDYQCLHFEACYYQGIEYCIEQGLRRFDSGAQGEHKISRGFEPVTICSAHWLKNSDFAEAIKHFLAHEQKAVHNYQKDAASYLPYKKPRNNIASHL